MTTRQSAKAKGRLAQAEVAQMLLERYLNINHYLESRDIVSSPASVPGVDIILSERAKGCIPFDIEVKNQAKVSIWSWMKQAEDNAGKGRIPLLVFKRSRGEYYACLKLNDLIKLDIGQ